MNIQLTGHHVDVTPALREHLVEKLERVKHHFDHAVEVKAIFSVEKICKPLLCDCAQMGTTFMPKTRKKTYMPPLT